MSDDAVEFRLISESGLVWYGGFTHVWRHDFEDPEKSYDGLLVEDPDDD